MNLLMQLNDKLDKNSRDLNYTLDQSHRELNDKLVKNSLELEKN